MAAGCAVTDEGDALCDVGVPTYPSKNTSLKMAIIGSKNM
jgi:hypothetical protein